ncbi:MAG: lamin tail domain-containing protein [Caldilineaceae bacterium]
MLLTMLLVAGIGQPTNAEALPAAAQIDALRQSNGNVSALKLNEIMADNGGIVLDPANVTGGRDDWFEIYNPTGETINLQGLYVTDSLIDLTKHQITESLTISPGGYLVIWADDEPFQGPNHVLFKFKNEGEALALVDSDGATIIDSHTFGQQIKDITEGRLPDGDGAWVKLSKPSPGQPNQIIPIYTNVVVTPAIPAPSTPIQVSATVTDDQLVVGVKLFYRADAGDWQQLNMTDDGATNYSAQIPGQSDGVVISYYMEAEGNDSEISTFPRGAPDYNYKLLVGYQPPPLVINEIMASNATTLEDPDEPGEFPDWLELYNYGDETVSLDGYFLSDDPFEPTKYAIPAGLRMPAKTYFMFYVDDDGKQGPQHTNFKLGEKGETIGLYGPLGGAPIDVVIYGQQITDISYGRYPDGETLTAKLCATPGFANQLCDKTAFLPLVHR